MLSLTLSAEWPKSEYNSSPGVQVKTLILFVPAFDLYGAQGARKIDINNTEIIFFTIQK
jgi:hypothetical protein